MPTTAQHREENKIRVKSVLAGTPSTRLETVAYDAVSRRFTVAGAQSSTDQPVSP